MLRKANIVTARPFTGSTVPHGPPPAISSTLPTASEHRAYSLTPEGATVVSRAEPIADASVDGSLHRVLSTTAASSGHSNCPPRIRHLCLGQLPEGWVRAGVHGDL